MKFKILYGKKSRFLSRLSVNFTHKRLRNVYTNRHCFQRPKILYFLILLNFLRRIINKLRIVLILRRVITY